MQINIKLPNWDWIVRIIERLTPNTLTRSKAWGKARSERQWLRGAIKASVEIEQPKSDA